MNKKINLSIKFEITMSFHEKQFSVNIDFKKYNK